MNRHITLPSTKEGEQLKLTPEQEKLCKVVYRKHKEEDNSYVFHEIWNPDVDYSNDYIILPVRSTFGGTTPYTPTQPFANIIGSTKDPHPPGSGSSWLDLFRANKIPCDQCVTDGYFYDQKDLKGKTYYKDYSCGGGMVGGHVVADFYNDSPKIGSTVYLIPICHNHNSCSTDYSGNPGSGFYMLPKSIGTAIILTNYFQLP